MNKDYLYNVSTYLLTKLLKGCRNDDKSKELLVNYCNYEYDPEELGIMRLVTVYLISHPFFDGKVSSLDWKQYNMRYYTMDNYMDDYIYTELDFLDCEDEIENNYIETKNGKFLLNNLIAYDKICVGEKLNNVNKDDLLCPDWYYINKYSDYDDEEVERMQDNAYANFNIGDKFMNGKRLDMKKIYLFIRNSFAHCNWKYVNGCIEMNYIDSKDEDNNFKIVFTINLFISLINQYIGIIIDNDLLSKDDNIIDDVLQKDMYEIVESEGWDFERTIRNVLEITDKTLYKDDFRNKLNDFFNNVINMDYKKNHKIILEYILQYGDISDETRKKIQGELDGKEVIVDDYETEDALETDLDTILKYLPPISNKKYICEKLEEDGIDYKLRKEFNSYYLFEFLKKYFKGNPYFLNYINFNKKLAEDIYSLLAGIYFNMYNNDTDIYGYHTNISDRLSNVPNEYFISDYYNEIETYKADIYVLLNSLFVQNDFHNIDVSSMTFSSLQLSNEYLRSMTNNYIAKKQRIEHELNEYQKKYFEKFYTAQSKIINSESKGQELLKKAELKREKYNKMVGEKSNELVKLYNDYLNSRNCRNNIEIIEHIRNSLAHGNLNVYIAYTDEIDYEKSYSCTLDDYKYDVNNIDIIINDYDNDGNLSFSGTVKLVELLKNVFNPEIVKQLFPKPFTEEKCIYDVI